MKADSGRPLNGLSILVVDDQVDMRDLFAYLLKGSGARVHVAAGAMAALDILAEDTPDVIVSDIAMPEEDGYSLMRQVRSLGQEEKRKIPAIAVTAFTSEGDRLRALAAGFNLHMAKPIDAPRLVQAVFDLAHSQ